ncbi:hypothetical protein [Edaphocola aurantiacus]|uniref:hypothetical protein n=1 Tax=Edaphocola aurantiacus TaxID=2601682 RepID=UPI001C9704AB|nr:hypothetical protein [Edaphocola aurantiacus]
MKIIKLFCALMFCFLVGSSCAIAQKKIGAIENGLPVLRTDESRIKNFLVTSGYAAVESINIATDNKVYVLQIIVVSKDGTRALLAKKLLNEGGSLIIDNESVGNDLMYKHTCSGNPCSNCDFTGTFDIGCKCGKETNGRCNHTVSSELSFPYPEFYAAIAN